MKPASKSLGQDWLAKHHPKHNTEQGEKLERPTQGAAESPKMDQSRFEKLGMSLQAPYTIIRPQLCSLLSSLTMPQSVR